MVIFENIEFKSIPKSIILLSKKFVLFFVSIYAVFATLLYIINSKKFNGEE